MRWLDDFPFTTVTLAAFWVWFFSAWLGGAAQVISKGHFKGDTFLDRWWDAASFVRLFTVRRGEVHLSFSWACIVVFRAAFAVSAISLCLDLAFN